MTGCRQQFLGLQIRTQIDFGSSPTPPSGSSTVAVRPPTPTPLLASVAIRSQDFPVPGAKLFLPALSCLRRSPDVAKMRTLATLAAAVVTTAAAQSTLLWHQAVDTAVYTSAGLSRRAGQTPTFSTATVRNPQCAGCVASRIARLRSRGLGGAIYRPRH